MTGQVLSGIGMGSTLSVGALLATDLSGSAGWSGMAATLSTLGAATAALPLARLAVSKGRAVSLSVGAWVATTGAILAATSAVVRSFPLLLLSLLLIGVSTAVNLQARFAATDVATPKTRATDLSLVVWATTVGAVSGPNLIGPGDILGGWLGLPALAGPFLFTVIAQSAAGVIYLTGLRPDPLRFAREHPAADEAGVGSNRQGTDHPHRRRLAFVALALSHATMVSVMAMTPVHLVDHGASLVVVGFTISLHIAGMYALSPVFGYLADRFGRIPLIIVGQGLLSLSLFATGLGSEVEGWVVVGLILLGLGWSSATVAASALLTESTPLERRTQTQGLSDVIMSGSGALGGGLSGVILLMVGYSGLSFTALALVATVLVLAVLTESRDRTATPA